MLARGHRKEGRWSPSNIIEEFFAGCGKEIYKQA
jgi:hypothetical protein